MSQHLIERLIDLAIDKDLLAPRDATYARNQIMMQLGISVYVEPTEQATGDIPETLSALIDDAVKRDILADQLDLREQLDSRIMNVFLSKPSEVNEKFWLYYNEDPKKATEYFYTLSENSHYIQTDRIKRNVHFEATSPYGKIDITINLSKPEKDPEQIKRERAMKPVKQYPLCLLCKENEGYAGRTGHPARSNHRIIDLDLLNEAWYFQYSPYVYYPEHSIVFCHEHRPMAITEETFKRLLSFVKQFPHYFIGSNADLPIVGGSILSHDHYQAGHYRFGMTEADDAFGFDLEKFPSIKASVLNWPMSVIRLRGLSIDALVEAGGHILNTWKDYSDEEADILAYSKKTPHNTITPIARFENGYYELDLVLRNNRTTDEHPGGIFHPHQDVHHIKKENIGLIEVMGLAVLPPRLKDELETVKAFLLGQASEVEPIHQVWAESLKDTHTWHISNADEQLETELAKKFVRVLEDSGVFKSNTVGRAAFKRFIHTL